MGIPERAAGRNQDTRHKVLMDENVWRGSENSAMSVSAAFKKAQTFLKTGGGKEHLLKLVSEVHQEE